MNLTLFSLHILINIKFEWSHNWNKYKYDLYDYFRFFNEMGGGSSKTTVNYLISLIDRVHKIYEDTIWSDKPDGQGFSGMGFIIKKIVVHR